ncbi:hypothetical protein COB21_05720, partial [Candidatus Aerophobetes bacterium]
GKKADTTLVLLSTLPQQDLEQARQILAPRERNQSVGIFSDTAFTHLSIDALVDMLSVEGALPFPLYGLAAVADADAKFAHKIDQALALIPTNTPGQRPASNGKDWTAKLGFIFTNWVSIEKTKNPAVQFLSPFKAQVDLDMKIKGFAHLSFTQLLQVIERNKGFKSQLENLFSRLGINAGAFDSNLKTLISAWTDDYQSKLDVIIKTKQQPLNKALRALAQLQNELNEGKPKRERKKELPGLISQQLKELTQLSFKIGAEVDSLKQLKKKINVCAHHVNICEQNKYAIGAQVSAAALRVYSRFDLPFMIPPGQIIDVAMLNTINDIQPKKIVIFVDGNTLVHTLNSLKNLNPRKRMQVILMPVNPRSFNPWSKASEVNNLEYIAEVRTELMGIVARLKARNIDVCRFTPRISKSDRVTLGYSKASTVGDLAGVEERDDEDAESVSSDDTDGGGNGVGAPRGRADSNASIDSVQSADDSLESVLDLDPAKVMRLYFHPSGAGDKTAWAKKAKGIFSYLQIPKMGSAAARQAENQ